MNESLNYYAKQIQDASQSLADPLFAYELLIHGPVLLSALALLLVIALACTGGKSPALRYTAMVCFAFAALAVVGAGASYDASKSFIASILDTTANQHFETLLMWGWIPPAAACLILLVTIASGSKLRVAGLVLSVLFAASAVLSGFLVSFNHLVVNEPGIAEALIERQTLEQPESADDETDRDVQPERDRDVDDHVPPTRRTNDNKTIFDFD